MSLINDALKRTKDAQQQNPPPAEGPPLKPADPAEAKTASNAKTLLYIMVACVVFGNALLFLALKDRGAKKAEPTAVPGAAAVVSVTAPPTNPAPAVISPVAVVPPPAKIQTAPAVAPVIGQTNVPPERTVAVAPPEPPKPAPLRLQSIIFNPARPSAMISGKFVLIGDKVQGFRVTAMDQETVTLVGNGQTNVLSLP